MPVPPPERVVALALLLASIVCVPGLPGATAGRSSEAAPNTSPQVAHGAISGVVVEGGAQTPVAHAVVSLSGRAGGSAPRTADRQLTDEHGRFVFINLPPDTYRLTVDKPGYVSRSVGPAVQSSQTVVPLASGQWQRTIRLWLWRPGSISGTVFDDTGQPVVGSIVQAVTSVVAAGRPRVVRGAIAVTDDRGRYRLSYLAPGRHYVFWRPGVAGIPASSTDEWAGGSITDYPLIYAGGARRGADATPVELSPGEARDGVDFHVAPVPLGGLAGRLTGPMQALVGTRLRMIQDDGPYGPGGGHEIATALVGADGRFSFPPVPAGRYIVESVPSRIEWRVPSAPGASAGAGREREAAPPAMAQGGLFRLPSDADDVWLAYRDEGAREDAVWVRTDAEITGGTLREVVVPVRPTVSISGRVIVEDARDTPGPLGRGASPALPANAMVAAEPVQDSLGMPTARVRPDGTFTLTGLFAGEYYLTLPTLFSGSVKAIASGGRDYLDAPFDASAGQDYPDVVITVTTSRAAIAGRVFDARGAAVPHATILCFPADPSLWTRFGLLPRRMGTAVADPDGSFRIDGFGILGGGLPEGEYALTAVRAVDAGSWARPELLEAAARVASRVHARWEDTATVDLRLQEIGR